jgi:hypothetical protein
VDKTAILDALNALDTALTAQHQEATDRLNAITSLELRAAAMRDAVNNA